MISWEASQERSMISISVTHVRSNVKNEPNANLPTESVNSDTNSMTGRDENGTKLTIEKKLKGRKKRGWLN